MKNEEISATFANFNKVNATAASTSESASASASASTSPFASTVVFEVWNYFGCGPPPPPLSAALGFPLCSKVCLFLLGPSGGPAGSQSISGDLKFDEKRQVAFLARFACC